MIKETHPPPPHDPLQALPLIARDLNTALTEHQWHIQDKLEVASNEHHSKDLQDLYLDTTRCRTLAAQLEHALLLALTRPDNPPPTPAAR
jgi:hypothetical protein